MEIKPIAFFRSPLGDKFGTPRQAGLAPSLRGSVILEKEFNSPDALRGLEGFDYIWLIWGFHLNRPGAAEGSLTVRPPRLGGNERVGVFASRSPYRPNRLGMSSLRIEGIDAARGIIHVSGADLVDGTPIYDIKPYVEYSDSHPGARSGFVSTREWAPLEVVFPPESQWREAAGLSDEDLSVLKEILSQDPRPRYQDDPERIYGLHFAGRNIRFKVEGSSLYVIPDMK